MEINFKKYTKSMIIALSVYFVLFLSVFLPFLPRAAALSLLGEPFLWLMTLSNLLPLLLFALYFFSRGGLVMRFAVMACALAASFFSVFFALPLL